VTSITTSANFAQTNNCGSSVAAGSSCAINVTFTPQSGGSLTGTLTITDNSNGAAGSTQTVSLSGTGEDFTVAPPSGSSTSASVAPGSPATYTIAVGAMGGMNQAVSFTCSDPASESTCALSPNPANPGSNVTVTVNTTAPSALVPLGKRLPGLPGGQGLLVWAMLAALAWSLRASRKAEADGRRRWLPLALGLLLGLGMAGCGGGGGNGGTTNPGTPAGTYTLTVTGTVGSGATAVSHSTKLTLTVS
jgi:hypothetical protein